MPQDLLVSDPATANRLFREYSRSSAFKLSLGIQEIRMLRYGHYVDGFAWSDHPVGTPSEHAALKRLLDKGLVQRKEGESPQLTPVGKLVLLLLGYSGHIVPPPHIEHDRRQWSRLDVLKALHHAASWNNDIMWWPSDLVESGEQGLLIMRPKYDGDERDGLPCRWLIHEDAIERDFGE